MQSQALALNRKDFLVGRPKKLKSRFKRSRPGHSSDILVGSNLTAVTTVLADVKRVKCLKSEWIVEFRAVAERLAN